MAITLNATSKGNSTLLEGSHAAVLTGLEPARNERGEYLKWKFTVSENGPCSTVIGATPMTLDTGSKTRAWTTTLMGRELEDGKDFDMESLVGHGCRVVLTKATLADGRVVTRIDRLERKGGLVLNPGKAPTSTTSTSTTSEEENPF